jgi:acetylornithine/N-succinyldiaminopimelate aminotransferase
MLGIDIDRDAWPLLEAAVARADAVTGKSGLLLLSAGPQTLRLLPPYTIGGSEIEQGLGIIKELLGTG